MKCIAYASKVVAMHNGALIPAGLSSLLRTARKTNARLNITGIMSYRDGHYIQVLEGNDREIDQLYAKIASDPRHEQVTVFLESPITERAFPNWTMRLVESVSKDPHFLNFIDSNASTFNNLSGGRREKFKIFHHPKASNAYAVSSDRYEDKSLMLSAWPDFTSVPPTPVIVELCARLTKAPHTYNSLLDQGEFGTKRQLDKILNTFNAHEILILTDGERHTANKASPKKSGNFYSKMKNLLRRR